MNLVYCPLVYPFLFFLREREAPLFKNSAPATCFLFPEVAEVAEMEEVEEVDEVDEVDEVEEVEVVAVVAVVAVVSCAASCMTMGRTCCGCTNVISKGVKFGA